MSDASEQAMIGEQEDSAGGGEAAAPEAAARERKKRKSVVGLVTSDKMQKTRTVEVIRLEPHRRYGKYVRRRTTYKVHDADEVSREGDTVRISESRPLSKTKRWRLLEVVERSRFGVPRSDAEEGSAPSSDGGDS